MTRTVRRIEERRLRISRDARGLDVHLQLEARLAREERGGGRIEPAPLATAGSDAVRAWEERGDEWRAKLGGRWAHGENAELAIELVLRETVTLSAPRRPLPKTITESECLAEALCRDPITGATMRLVVPMGLGTAPSVRELLARTSLHARGRTAPRGRALRSRIELDPTATAQLVARIERRAAAGDATLTHAVPEGTAGAWRGPRVLHFPWIEGDDAVAEGMACVAVDGAMSAFRLVPFRLVLADVARALLRDDARGRGRLASRWDGVDVLAPSLHLETLQ